MCLYVMGSGVTRRSPAKRLFILREQENLIKSFDIGDL